VGDRRNEGAAVDHGRLTQRRHLAHLPAQQDVRRGEHGATLGGVECEGSGCVRGDEVFRHSVAEHHLGGDYGCDVPAHGFPLGPDAAREPGL